MTVQEKDPNGNEPSMIEQIEAEAERHGQDEEASDDNPEDDVEDDTPDRAGDQSENEDGEGGEDEDSVVSEDLIERAVRAGMSLSDAKAVTNAESLERIVSKLEGDKAGEGEESGEDKGGDDNALDIPDLDPDEYSEEIVDAFKGVKKVVAAQNETIRELRESLEAMKTRPKEDEGAEEEDDGGEAKVKAKAKAEAARKRSRRAINRPRTTSGRFSADEEMYGEDDRESEAVAAVAALMDGD